LAFLVAFGASGQGIKGRITDADGEPLGFATLYIKELGTGTTANEQGYYEMRLKPGQYELMFRYLGFETKNFSIEVGSGWTVQDVVLGSQVVQLKEVEVNAKAEDPAYTIIRKAIAKAKYHQLQVQHYTAKVYIKGGGRVKDVPFFLRKAMEKEGIDSSTVFLSESVSEVEFEQPNTLKERVISVRTIGQDTSGNASTANSYIYGSFYEPKIAGAISPLSPRAFGYYRFKLLGSYIENGYEINKIRVTPRSRGDDVFAGTLYLVEDLWCIHSLDLYTYKQGFKFQLEQIYAPIKEEAWLPMSHRFMIEGSMLGFDVDYKYLATVSDYQITLNPDLAPTFEVVDEKVDKELAKALEREEQLEELAEEDPEAVFAEKKKFTRKELKKALKNYEKQLEDEEWEEPNVVYSSTFEVDSLAAKRDSAYWAEIRPVPLNEMERKSYVKLDSMAVAEQQEAESDTLDGNKKRKTGSGALNVLGDVLFGTSWKLGKKTSLRYSSPLLSGDFNTVEGYNMTANLAFKYQPKKGRILEIKPYARYAFARDKLIGKLRTEYRTRKEQKRTQLYLEGGRFVQQFNPDEAISPTINGFSTLLWERNYMKIFEKDYAMGGVKLQPSDYFSIAADLSFAQRRQLFNNSDYVIIDNDERTYTPNAPINLEQVSTDFPEHEALVATVDLTYKPFLKYRERNGRRFVIDYSSPIFGLFYRQGFEDVWGSDVDFSMAELSMKHRLRLGVRGRLDVKAYAGTFFNNDQLYFMDFKHFPGNLTAIQQSDPVASYRLLDYYLFSTADQYVGGHAYYQFRKFLLTQIFEVQLMGLKENLLFNYLSTPQAGHYMEAGYSLDNIFRFFRVEAVASFLDGKYQDFGVRVGISTSLQEMFTSN